MLQFFSQISGWFANKGICRVDYHVHGGKYTHGTCDKSCVERVDNQHRDHLDHVDMRLCHQSCEAAKNLNI